MKLESFNLRLFPELCAKACGNCGKRLGQTLRLLMDARPGDEWEIRAFCSACARDYTQEAMVCHAFGSGKNERVRDISRRIRNAGLG